MALATGIDFATISQIAPEASGYRSGKIPFSSAQSYGVVSQSSVKRAQVMLVFAS